ncbi:MAG: thioredoxin domain-containing protein [Myxococcota bacterium]
MAVVTVTDTTFEEEVLRSELPVLVDLQADWCQPCKQLSPIVAEVAAELEGKLKVCAIDIDQSPMVAQMFRVQSIPMLVVLSEGRPVNHHLGLLDKAGVLALVEGVLPKDASEVKPDQLAALLQQNRAVPVDIRDATQFARYRIPGAINVPAAEAKGRAAELQPVDGRVRVLYARSTDEAKELAESLRSSQVTVGFLAGGFLHWEADGFAVERG